MTVFRQWGYACIVGSVSLGAVAQAPQTVDAPGGRAVTYTELPATIGDGLQCELRVTEVHDGGNWASTVALTLDEGAMEDRDSRFLQVDMSVSPDQAIHTVTKGGFGEEYQEPFLVHQPQTVAHTLTIVWERSGLFRYESKLGQSLLALGRVDQPGFNPKFVRATVIGMKVDIECYPVEAA